MARGSPPDSWEFRCGPLEAELEQTRYGYAMTPFPNLGGLDLAGLFMDRKKFAETGVYFSKLLNHVLNCLNEEVNFCFHGV